MGAWGPGIFDDDAAYDFIEIIQDADEPTEVFQTSFETALQAEYLEYDDAHAVTVSAAYIDAVLNGTSYESEDDEAITSFAKANKKLPLAPLKAAAVQALQKVIAENSELNELWKENEELYPQWKQNINALIERLR
ncbi:MAG TPA: DUF4259 domain-containing protein [Flavisolibacter sp.]|jgi:hypothetical protein|nr:DUF4259 domain-containing protein [Flavisolibacter sp.]